MARCALKNVVLHPTFRGVADREGSINVYYPGTTTAATVYQDATGTTALTAPIAYSATRFIDGFVEAGEYTLSTSSSGLTTVIEAGAGDNASGGVDSDPMVDHSLACFNFAPNRRNSIAATATSQLVRLIRIQPKAKIVAAKIVSYSGSTAVAATITKTVVGYYTTDGTTLTKVNESTTNLTTGLWDSTNTRYAQALNPATGILYPGQVYYVALLVNATTAGNLQGYVKVANVVDPTAADVPVPMYTKASETTLAATYAISGLTAAYDLIPCVGVLSA